MKPLIGLAARSLWNRRDSAALTVFAIGISVMLLVGVETVRTCARESFARTISGTDLIVGARSGPINLLLYAVFRIGDATANVSWQSFELVSRHPDVAWAIPISLGDSHRGYRVMGTTADYFRHYRYGNRQALIQRPKLAKPAHKRRHRQQGAAGYHRRAGLVSYIRRLFSDRPQGAGAHLAGSGAYRYLPQR